MKIKTKTGMVILLLAVLIPVAISVALAVASESAVADNSGSGSGSASSAAAVQTGPPTAPPAPLQNYQPSATSPSPADVISSGYSNGPYLYVSGLQSNYNWGNTTVAIPIKVELWDYNGAPLQRATIYSYLYKWSGSSYTLYTSQYISQCTGDDGLQCKLTWKLPGNTNGNYWQSFIEGYWYDINGGFHYAYQTKYFNT